MATSSLKGQKRQSSFIINAVLIIISLIWFIPTLGVLVTSFRQSQDIFRSGWWAILPHKEDADTGEILLDDSYNVDGVMEIEGASATFEELREGVVLPDGRKLTWYGNKRTRKIIIS